MNYKATSRPGLYILIFILLWNVDALHHKIDSLQATVESLLPATTQAEK